MNYKETLLSGIHLDKEFKVARERKRKPPKPYPKEAKEALERSIKTITVKNNNNQFNCQNLWKLKK